AFSYGSGSFEIAGMLQHHNVSYLAVAYADEGVELRRGGIKLPIMVMNPEPQSFEDLLHYNLEPEIFSHRIFDLFAEFVRSHAQQNKNIPSIHIKIDTGMHRLGFEEKETELLLKKIKANSGLKIASVFSHLAGSDEAALDGFTNEQLQVFISISEKIISILPYKILRHICNSAAIARFPQAHFDMVRLGIGMYGIGANEEEQKKLLNAGTLRSTISQIKHLPKGETVGYNRRGNVEKETTIATVPLGYADGYSRKLGNGKGCMYVNGMRAPVIGNVCMDMCMINITGINAKEGDEVIIFNSPQTITEMAKQSDTIAYEILTAISPRVKRIYREE
ncbi:MAG: alanine racemase, partial [Bacteroidia bacterium]|nr:alanine racemase [Bacteroidia bacterium]